jgi:formate-dependent nitrite reductase membrane component NrfD
MNAHVKCLLSDNMKRTLNLPCLLMLFGALASMGALDLVATLGHDEPTNPGSHLPFTVLVWGSLLFITYHLVRRLFCKKASGGLSISAFASASAGICGLLAALPPYNWGTLGLALVAGMSFLQWLGERRKSCPTLAPQPAAPEGL